METEKLAIVSENVNEVQTSSINQLNNSKMGTQLKEEKIMENLNKSGNAQIDEKANEVQTSSINPSKEEKMNRYLKESKGNMYEFVTHMFNPIIGECEHECGYCYVSAMVKKQNPIRLEEKALKGLLGNNNFIFVGSGTDFFADCVSSEWITKVLDYCNQFDNEYLFQSKNPERFIEFIDHPVFKKSVICTTIESNRDYEDCKAPSIENRVLALELIKSVYPNIKTYVTIEPIMNFDLTELVELIKRCQPTQVTVGADSKGNNLSEPNKEKTTKLINELSIFTTVIEKKNLKRIMNMKNTELRAAEKNAPKSILMKARIMTETPKGYEGEEASYRFGLVKENRPIRKADVNGFLKIIQEGRYKKYEPIVTMRATDLIDNYNITDLEGNPITRKEASEYLIALDGQHRITAFSKLNSIRGEENQIVIPNVLIEESTTNVHELLADLNMVGHNWSTGDKICVSAIATGSKLLEKTNELIKEGYTPTTATLICTGKRITPKQLNELIKTGDASLFKNEEESLERANKFVTITTSIVGDNIALLKKRYFINGFNSFVASRSLDEGLTALSRVTIEDFKETREDNEFVEKLKLALTE